MGFLKKLFGGSSEHAAIAGRIVAPTPPAQKPATTAQVEISQGKFRTGRPQVPDGPVEWPVDLASGLVFDDGWLLSGLKKAVNENQYRIKLEEREESAILRRERLIRPGTDGHDQRVDMLRGRDWLEWGEHVRQMKREGYLECALALVYEMIDTVSRSKTSIWDKVPPGWFTEAAIIHRKLKDYDGEIRLMRTALKSYPGAEDFQARLNKAQILLAKA
jgi:hypothetical protein